MKTIPEESSRNQIIPEEIIEVKIEEGETIPSRCFEVEDSITFEPKQEKSEDQRYSRAL